MKQIKLIFGLFLLLSIGIILPAKADEFVPSNDKVYNILNQRGNLGTKDGFLVSTVKTGIGATKGEFAILTYCFINIHFIARYDSSHILSSFFL